MDPNDDWARRAIRKDFGYDHHDPAPEPVDAPAPVPLLLDAIPAWRDDERRAADSEAMAEWAARNGFTVEDLAVLGTKEILALHRAWRSEGSSPSKRQSRAATNHAKRELARSGRLRDAEAAIEALLNERRRG